MSEKRNHAKEQEQSRRFIETARELGCDEDPEAFKRALRQIAKPKPKLEHEPIVAPEKQKK